MCSKRYLPAGDFARFRIHRRLAPVHGDLLFFRRGRFLLSRRGLLPSPHRKGNPIKLDGQRLSGNACPPLNADADALLRELGYNDADRVRLLSA